MMYQRPLWLACLFMFASEQMTRPNNRHDIILTRWLQSTDGMHWGAKPSLWKAHTCAYQFFVKMYHADWMSRCHSICMIHELIQKLSWASSCMCCTKWHPWSTPAPFQPSVDDKWMALFSWSMCKSIYRGLGIGVRQAYDWMSVPWGTAWNLIADAPRLQCKMNIKMCIIRGLQSDKWVSFSWNTTDSIHMHCPPSSQIKWELVATLGRGTGPTRNLDYGLLIAHSTPLTYDA